MGYFSAPFVFLDKPDWESLNRLPPGIALRGYEYRHGPVWLLDFWKPSRKPHYPFADGWSFSTLRKIAPDDVARAFDQTARTMDGLKLRDESGWIHLAAAVCRLVGGRVFFFAGDDNGVDFACRAVGGVMENIACDLDSCRIIYADGIWNLAPLPFPGTLPSERDLRRFRARMRGLAHARELHPVRREFMQMFEHAVTGWPTDAGPPERVIGLGTWELFDNIETDFVTQFERVHTSEVDAAVPGAWWRFWRRK